MKYCLSFVNILIFTAFSVQAMKNITIIYKPHITNHSSDVNVCDERIAKNAHIYCYGKLLHAVNRKRIYTDSKTFVDMPMTKSPEIVQAAFQERFGELTVDQIDRSDLEAFLKSFFSEPGTELEECKLKDWKKEPSQLMSIKNLELRQWALNLNNIWLRLCRKMKSDVPFDQNSLIYVPELFIVPGGRFREYYYWDAYWIIKGLLASGMHETSKSMLKNFASLINRYGFIPNGGRIYYLKRSQPPLFAGMIYEYIEKTNDLEFLKEVLPVMEIEIEFWNNHRSVEVIVSTEKHRLYQYRTESNVPRPESYWEDYSLGKGFGNEKLSRQFYQDIASAAESGWDFSSRWFKDKKQLINIETTNIIPVDLNAFMCWNLQILSYFNSLLGDRTNSLKYERYQQQLRYSIKQVLYDEKIGLWFDYNIRTLKLNEDYYASSLTPLFTGCYEPLDLNKLTLIQRFMELTGAVVLPGGIPASLNLNSKEQWDYPNGWSPSNHMIIEGLRKSDHPQAQELAFQIAKKWITGNYEAFKQTGHMWEKYNVIGKLPVPGSGGEYAVQDGFGWTNGVILDLLVTYGNRMSLNDTVTPHHPKGSADAMFETSHLLNLLISFLCISLFNMLR